MSKVEEMMHKSLSYMRQKKKEAIWLIEIATLEKDIRFNYEEIGRLYYKDANKIKDVLDYDYFVRRIQDLEKEIVAIRRKLKEISEV